MSNQEIKNAVDDMIEGFQTFKADNDSRLDDIETRMARMDLGLGGGGTKGTAEIEHAAIGTFAKTDDARELKALSVGDDPSGGYYVLTHHSKVIQSKLNDMVVMRRLSRTETIDSGDAWEEPWDNEDVGASRVGRWPGPENR